MDISESEAKELLKDMDSILKYVGDIKEAVTTEVLPEAGMLRNIMREDGEPHKPGNTARKYWLKRQKRKKNM